MSLVRLRPILMNPSLRILVIGDEPKAIAYLQKGLSESGFRVDVASRGEDGLHLAVTEPYTLIVLDIVLPDCDQWGRLRTLRAAGHHHPVLILFACDFDCDRRHARELGADDVLVKPFAFAELLNRIRTLLHSDRANPAGPLQLADLEIDLLHRRSCRAGLSLELTPKEFTLLALLAQHAGEVLPPHLIAEQVWAMDFDSDTHIIDVAIHRLRAKIDDPFPRKLLHTVRGVGYVLEAR